ncbi:MAG: hypothetical protein GC192_12060 [Bacteroidetes bacterium]|nr:hypothetical protein [Bacteroidota bacterium]
MKNALKSILACFAMLLLTLSPLTVFSQQKNEVKWVSFTISNPSLKSKDLDVRYFDPITKKTAGYGLHLGPLQSHADNKPVGTRIYLKNWDGYQLAFVLSADDDGRKFNLDKAHEISPEQRLQAVRDEESEKKAALENPDEDDDLGAFAKRHNVPMVTFTVAGKSLLKRQVHVRAQLPFVNERTNNGFSRKLSSFSHVKVSYPAGTKIYLCDGPYWNSGNVKETLLLTVDTEKVDYLIKI